RKYGYGNCGKFGFGRGVQLLGPDFMHLPRTLFYGFGGIFGEVGFDWGWCNIDGGWDRVYYVSM
ncbi:hypothetical protein, partial [Halocalculus aciditolerans]|uniref:hypothetical protein n=1 Tax=Halocalculus aciditolerans TaxID=1383812 RepID=UPI001E3B2C3A